MPTECEVAWAAGYFEGEGYFSGIVHELARGRRRRYPYAGINNTDYSMLVRFQGIVGVGKIRTRTPDTKFNSKPQWRWLVSNREGVEHVFRLLEPWLSEERLTKARAAMTSEVESSEQQLELD